MLVPDASIHPHHHNNHKYHRSRKKMQCISVRPCRRICRCCTRWSLTRPRRPGSHKNHHSLQIIWWPLTYQDTRTSCRCWNSLVDGWCVLGRHLEPACVAAEGDTVLRVDVPTEIWGRVDWRGRWLVHYRIAISNVDELFGEWRKASHGSIYSLSLNSFFCLKIKKDSTYTESKDVINIYFLRTQTL